jgi:streptogramin lyase
MSRLKPPTKTVRRLILVGLASGGAFFMALSMPAENVSSAGFSEFPLPTPHGYPMGITAGPDGNLWFTEENAIGRITPQGQITEYHLLYGCLSNITVGPDGNLWATERCTSAVDRITPQGVITGLAASRPTMKAAGIYDIATGPDGNLWYTESFIGQIGRMTPGGVYTEFALPAGRVPASITAGPDNAMWFTESGRVGRISLDGGIQEFVVVSQASGGLRGLSQGSGGGGITSGPDGNLWLVSTFGLKRVTTGGVMTEFRVPPGGQTWSCVTGPDGAIWFTDNGLNGIGRMTTSGEVTEYQVPTALSHPWGIAVGPDGAIWFTETLGNKIGRFEIPKAVAAPSAVPLLSANALAVFAVMIALIGLRALREGAPVR